MKMRFNFLYIIILFLFLANFAFSLDCANSICGDGYGWYEVGDSLRTESYTVVFSIVMPSDHSINFAIWNANATEMLELVNVPEHTSFTRGNLTIYLCETERYPRQEACIKVKEISPLIVVPSEGRIDEELICKTNIDINKGWNLVSFPVVGKEVDEVVFNLADIKIYNYSKNKYEEVNTIEPLKGYWIYTEHPQTISLSGTPVCEGYITLENEWNLIGTTYMGFDKEQLSTFEKYGIKEFYNYDLQTNNYGIVDMNLNKNTNGFFVKNPFDKITIKLPMNPLCADECRERPSTPECGDGIIQEGETCDDGNLIDGDGCSSNCLLECTGTMPLDIMLVIDTSNSMNMREIGDPLSRLDYATASASFFVGTLNPENDKLGLVNFGSHAFLRHILTFEHHNVITAINTLTASGTTNLCAAILTAQGEFDSSRSRDEAKHIMIILSDGAPSAYAYDEADAAKASGTIIYAINVMAESVTHLREICSSDEHYFYAPSESDLISIYEQISEHITDCCGDGIHNEGEECDYNNPLGPPCDEECNLIILPTYCGDDEVQYPNSDSQFETCDPPGNLMDPNSHPCRDDCTYCGDGELDFYYEECDDANSDNIDMCLNTCILSYCGDGFIQLPNSRGEFETCDPNVEGVIEWGPWDNPCRLDCTYCGDGIRQEEHGETCDNPLDSLCRNDCTYCGDGETNFPFEECDDGNIDPTDGCHECILTDCGDGIVQSPNGYGFYEECDGGLGCFDDCTLMPIIYCGDNDIDPGESCEPPLSSGWGPHENECRLDCTYCGDGTTQTINDEECDDANTNENDLCLNTCIFNICGDGVINEEFYKIATGDILEPFVFLPYETCDPPGIMMPNGNNCRDDCTYCGDGYTQVSWDEKCDGEDYCRDDCTYCGDGIRQEEHGETCDNPLDPLCRDDCTYCGDGELNSMWEECDDGNDNNYDGCTNECLFPYCGDTFIYTNLNETCDPPGEEFGVFNNPCRDDCTYCGDGIIQPTLGYWVTLESDTGPEYIITYKGESCEPILNKSCRTDCTMCGDGIIDWGHGETCDGQPGCRSDCTYCGDGIQQEVHGEACDDANSNNNDECLNNCQRPYCGDEYIQMYISYLTETGELITLFETCETPGTIMPNENECRDDCTYCGDDIVQEGESCDGQPGCRSDCTMCGDGELQLEHSEECDDGNLDNSDYCTTECKLAICGDGYLQSITGEQCEEGDLSLCRDLIVDGIEMNVQGCKCCNCLYDVEIYNTSYFDCSLEQRGECFYNDDCFLYPYAVCVRDVHMFGTCELIPIFGSDLELYMDTAGLFRSVDMIKHNSRKNTFYSKLNDLTYEISWEDGGRGTCDDIGTSIHRYGGFIQLILNNKNSDYINSITTKLKYSDTKRLEFNSDYASPFVEENTRFLIQLWEDVHDVPLNSKFNFTINETSECKCGNDILETGEACDEGLNNGIPCIPFFNETCTMCSNLCTLEELNYSDENVWLIRENTKLESGKTYTNQFKIVGNNLFFDCNGAILNGYFLPSYNIGIEVFKQNNVTIKNCHIEHYDIGIYAHNSNYLNLLNNYIAENKEYGIYVFDSEHINMNGNTAGGNFAEGIYLKEVDHSQINHTNIYANLRSGIRLESCYNNKVAHLISNRNINSGFILSNSNDNEINNVYVSNNTQTGLSLVSSSNNIISQGHSNENFNGVYLTYGSSNNGISDIEVKNNLWTGVSIRRDSNNNEFFDNIVCENIRYAFHSSVGASNNTGNNICNTRKILDDVGTNIIVCAIECS